ncbi:MAG: SRPBCC family protein [Prevotellaceae bacterium]|nr:SRPBCC family protein [Prevotellaceae bacterium]
MTKYESSVKHIPCPIESVYAKLSDMTSLEALRERLGDPLLRERIMAQAGDKISPEQYEQMAAQLEAMQFTRDTITADMPMVGSVTLRVVEREELRLVKCETEGSPIYGNLWIQLLPEGEGCCAMKVTLGAELNFMLKQMLGGKLEKGVEKLADLLAMMPY